MNLHVCFTGDSELVGGKKAGKQSSILSSRHSGCYSQGLFREERSEIVCVPCS